MTKRKWKPNSGSFKPGEDHRNYAHGKSYTPEYRAWLSMKTRCYNQNYHLYDKYGGRGIKVCNRWKNSFENFLADVGQRPSSKHSLDRRDNNGNYEPKNVRWATPKEQNNNQSNTPYITYNGETRPIGYWAKKLNISNQSLRYRVKHWTVEEAVTLPPQDSWSRGIRS